MHSEIADQHYKHADFHQDHSCLTMQHTFEATEQLVGHCTMAQGTASLSTFDGYIIKSICQLA